MFNIPPQYLTLAQLLEGRLFLIPDYQRAYSWSALQRNDLFSDIEKTFCKGCDEGHFMAAIVCLRRKKKRLGTNEFLEMEVVDGQQRLTTLITLLNVIKLELDKTNPDENKIYQEIEVLLVKPKGDNPLILQSNHDNGQHFAKFLRQGKFPPSSKAQTLSHREILAAIEDCERFVEKWKIEQRTLADLVDLLKDRLFFLLHDLNDEKLVYTAFEVLNSRGLDVSWTDRLKSILMGLAFELPDSQSQSALTKLQQTWNAIYKAVGLRQELSAEALRFAATLKEATVASRSISERNAVEFFRDRAIDEEGIINAPSIQKDAKWLLDVTRACAKVRKKRRIEAVTSISQVRMLATAIYLRPDIKVAQRDELLKRWEKVSFRMYGMMRTDARKGVGDYVSLSWRIIHHKLSVAEIDAAIAKIGKECPIDEAIAALRGRNCYDNWQSELRYMMYRYEEYLSRKQKVHLCDKEWEEIWEENAANSIEHIWPQSKATNKHKHRLGNLMLLTPELNFKLRDRNPKAKAGPYQEETELLMASEVAKTIHSGGWTIGAIDAREEALLKWAKTEWAD